MADEMGWVGHGICRVQRDDGWVHGQWEALQ